MRLGVFTGEAALLVIDRVHVLIGALVYNQQTKSKEQWHNKLTANEGVRLQGVLVSLWYLGKVRRPLLCRVLFPQLPVVKEEVTRVE